VPFLQSVHAGGQFFHAFPFFPYLPLVRRTCRFQLKELIYVDGKRSRPLRFFNLRF